MLRRVALAFGGAAELSEREGALLVAAAGVIFSFTAIVFRAVDKATDWQFLTFRGLATTLAMLVLIALRRRSDRPVRIDTTGAKTVLAGLILGVTSMLYILALARISAATTLFMVAVAPVFAAIFGWLLLREPVHRTTVTAGLLAGVGVAIMVGAGLEGGSGWGLLLASLIPVFVGLYNVLIRSEQLADPVIPTLIAGVTVAVGSGLAALATDGLGVSLGDALLGMLAGGVFLGLGLPLFNLGHRSVPAARVSLLLMTEVVLAPLWVWIWPGETPSTGTLIGGAIVLGAVAWLVTRTGD